MKLICRIISITGLILLVNSGLGIAITPRPNVSPSPTQRPTLAIDCPRDVLAGQKVEFRASLKSADAKVPPVFQWNISGGLLVGGQGTSTITIDTHGLEYQTLSVTVEVGFGESSRRESLTATCSVLVQGSLRLLIFWPKEIKVGDTDKVTCLLLPGQNEAEKKQEDVESKYRVSSSLVKTGSSLKVSLIAQNFNLQALNSSNQTISRTSPTEWQWLISPREPAMQQLQLVLEFQQGSSLDSLTFASYTEVKNTWFYRFSSYTPILFTILVVISLLSLVYLGRFRFLKLKILERVSSLIVENFANVQTRRKSKKEDLQ